MSIAYRSDDVLVWQGDCVELMRSLPDQCMDSIVTDPPYGINFMGKDWDTPAGQMVGQIATGLERATSGPLMRGGTHSRGYADNDNRAFEAWCELWAVECFRVLKPGGHLLAFGGTRTWHRLTAGIEDAGFEIRDSIAWLYGSGFPKSLDVSKAIDKAAGAEREIIRERSYVLTDGGGYSGNLNTSKPRSESSEITAPATEDAQKWAGWGTALKPAFEPIVVARKPLTGTVAANVLEHGTGALNIDATRIDHDPKSAAWVDKWSGHEGHPAGDFGTIGRQFGGSAAGRWPANVVLDPHAATLLDEQSGTKMSRGHTPGRRKGATEEAVYGLGHAGQASLAEAHAEPEGGASRFYYVAKAPKSERPQVEGSGSHPTVKPLKLMQWLVRLVTPPGGNVLDPFAGSGTTVEACLREGLRCMAMERETDYLPLILHRIDRHKKRAANASDH